MVQNEFDAIRKRPSQACETLGDSISRLFYRATPHLSHRARIRDSSEHWTMVLMAADNHDAHLHSTHLCSLPFL